MSLICLFTLNSAIICGSASLSRFDLERMYQLNYSDGNTYLAILKSLASECSSIAELGEQKMVSTWGLLLGIAEGPFYERSYMRIARYTPPIDLFRDAVVFAETNGISFFNAPLNDDFLGLMEADLLFIDAMDYAHLLCQLKQYSVQIGKYIVVYRSEAAALQRVTQELTDSEWDRVPLEDESLVIFKRKVSRLVPQFKRFDESERMRIDQVLKNKIILCTGPSLHRRELLKKTTESDMRLIPFKKIFFSTNDPALQDITFNGIKPVCQLMRERGHQLDCLNCMLTSIRNAVTDPEVDDDDIIIFKHETVFINDMNLVRHAIKKILEGSSMVIRYHFRMGCMGDVFFAKVSAVRDQFKHREEVTDFSDGSEFCEEYLTKVVNGIPNVHHISYSHRSRKDTELGFFHIITAKGEYDQDGYWDKKNYDELF